jgi:IPT/TIG domain
MKPRCGVALAAAVVCLFGAVSAAEALSVPFSPTGAEQNFVVPAGVTRIHVVAVGGSGGISDGSPFAPGGAAAQVSGALGVTPGETLYVEVGGSGGSAAAAFGGGAPGGGTTFGSTGGEGGGASDVRMCSVADLLCPGGPLASRRVVAAGGGGGGGPFGGGGGNGGSGGCSSGVAGTPGTAGDNGGGGGGGTHAAGGVGGSAGANSSAGTGGALGQGGTGGFATFGGAGGGGGGGYYGGGGGGGADNHGGGGGGGSSLVPTHWICETAGTGPSVTFSYRSSPVLTSTASAGITTGGLVHDTVTLSGGHAPTGTVTFRLYGPHDPDCSGGAISTGSVSVSGDGSYQSAVYRLFQAGTYRWTVDYSGDADNDPAAAHCNAPHEQVEVAKASPTLTTTASPGGAIGGTVHDTAWLSGGLIPFGSITFKLYRPADPLCVMTPLFASTVLVNGSIHLLSGAYSPASLGTYHWTAHYSGDANNNPAVSGCQAANEAVTISQATPTLTTAASAPITIGGSLRDTATLTGFRPTGTLTFALYDPGDVSCRGAPVFSVSKAISKSGTYESAPFTPAALGVYRWIASYSGDANNQAVTGTCADPAEAVSVSKAPVTLQTSTTSDTTLGGSATDTGTLSHGHAPGGTLTFYLYGPDDASCSGQAIFVSTKRVQGNRSYASDPFAPIFAGAYRWTVAYSGDAFNTAASSPCNAAGQVTQVTVPTGWPTIVSFSPTSGPRGKNVIIVGTNLSHVTSVLFNGVRASFKILADNAIDAEVPTAATTGRIRVVNALGWAVSTASFVVTG